MTDRFNPDDNDDEIENSLFDEEWYGNVTKAINYTFEILESDNRKIVANKEAVAKAIIDWNIEKRLTEKISILPIPEVLDWTEATAVQIFDEFASVICLCAKNKEFKKHIVKIKCGKNKSALEQFRFWEDVSNNEENGLIISDHIQKNNTIVCVIKKKV